MLEKCLWIVNSFLSRDCDNISTTAVTAVNQHNIISAKNKLIHISTISLYLIPLDNIDIKIYSLLTKYIAILILYSVALFFYFVIYYHWQYISICTLRSRCLQNTIYTFVFQSHDKTSDNRDFKLPLTLQSSTWKLN